MRKPERLLNVLLIEDETADAQLVLRELERAQFTVKHHRVDDARDLAEALTRSGWDVVLSDYAMPGFDGMQALKMVRDRDADLPFIIISGAIGEEQAVAAMRAGANDYLIKGRLQRLAPVVERELREVKSRHERRRLEQHLFQNAKEESIGRLASGVAHDFNNLLTAVVGYTDLLETRLPPGSPAVVHLRGISEAARRGVALTQQLLAFARRQVIQPRLVDLGEAVKRACNMLPVLIGAKIDFELIIDEDLPPVLVDPNQVEQIVMNLAANARDAMPDGGELTVAVELVTLDADACADVPDLQPGPYVTIAVTDTGQGMTADVIEHIFEPFFTTKEANKGTGLGLAMCQGIVRQNRGHITVSSVRGSGTVFRVHFPAAQGTVPSETKKSDRLATVGGKETVLLVEDEPLIRSMALDYLDGLGYRVMVAADGGEAFVLAENERIDILVTDVVLPQLSGVDVAKRLSRSQPRMRVLYISGYGEDALAEHDLLRPDVTVLQKPFVPSVLAAAIRKVLMA